MAFRFITVFPPLLLPLCVLEIEPRALCMLGLTRCRFDNGRSNKNLKFDMTSNPMTCLHLDSLLSSVACLCQLSSHKDKEIFLNSNETSDFLAKPSNGFKVKPKFFTKLKRFQLCVVMCICMIIGVLREQRQ